MNFILLIITIISSLFGLGSMFMVIFQPRIKLNKLITLNKNVRLVTQLKIKLESEIENLSREKIALDSTYTSVRLSTHVLQEELKSLSTSLSSTKNELELLNKKNQLYSDQLKGSQIELLNLRHVILEYEGEAQYKKQKLGTVLDEFEQASKRLNKGKNEYELLKIEASDLRDQKLDLEKENSHLSWEIAKKKITYGTAIKQYNDETGDKRTVKHIGYKPCSQYPDNTYPLVFMPHENAVIKFPRKGKIGIRGFTEPVFEDVLKTYFLRQRDIQVYEDRFLIVSDNTRPFEPDFSLIDEKDNLNLFIDVEIDEPYDGINRFAMHYEGVDDSRNQYFTNRGWIVIRFSEKQIHTNAKGCARFIADVIICVNPEFKMPHDLITIQPLAPEALWSKLQSEKWAAEDYRETYLGIESFTEKQKVIIDTSNLFQNESEIEVEEMIPDYKDDKQKLARNFNELNQHHRDARIKFFPKKHLYLIDDNPKTISASTLVRLFFNEFDKEYWAERKSRNSVGGAESLMQYWESNNKEAAELGTQLHLDIEKYFDSKKAFHPEDSPEFIQFLEFMKNIPEEWKIYRTEWRIFDDFHYVAGTADMILKKPDGSHVILDWKRSHKIKKYNQYQNGFGICDDLDDCNFNHYSLQLNIYKMILEDFYAKPVSEMKIIQFHPTLDDYEVYEVEDMQPYVEKMIEAAMHIK